MFEIGLIFFIPSIKLTQCIITQHKFNNSCVDTVSTHDKLINSTLSPIQTKDYQSDSQIIKYAPEEKSFPKTTVFHKATDHPGAC